VKKIIAVTFTVLLASAIIFGGCAGPAEDPTNPGEPNAKVITWRYTAWDPPFDTFSIDAEKWADELEEATDGRLKINFYWSESLVKMPGMFDAISSGTADVGNAVLSMFPEHFPMGRVCNLVFVYKDQPQTGQTWMALLNKYEEMRDELLPTRVIRFQAPPPEDLLLKKKAVHTMEDLKGMKIATTSPEAIKALQILGAVPVPINMTERYHALETGVIDGTGDEWNSIFLWKLYEVGKHITVNVGMRGRGFPTLLNIQSYNKLPEDIQQIFDELTDPMEQTILFNNNHVEFIKESEQKVREHFELVGNPPPYVLPDAERERWKDLTWSVNEDYIAELEAKGLPGRAFVEDALAFAEQYK